MSYLDYLLVIVPVAIVGHYLHWSESAQFALAAIGIVPLARLIGQGTEHLAARTGPKLGGLLNASLGNAAELIITIVAMLSVAVGVEMEVQRNIEAMGMESVFVTPPHAETGGFAPYAETRPGASIVSPQHMEAGGFDSYADSRPEVPITPAAVETLRRMPEVDSVAPLVDLPSYLDLRVKWGERAAPARVQSSTEQLSPFEGSSQVLAGRQLDPGEARGVVLSARLARDLGVGD